MVQLLWLRNDLRLHDHEGFRLASGHGAPLAVIFILPQQWLTNDDAGMNRLGSAKSHYLRSALIDLHRQLEDQTIDLHIFSGDPLQIFKDIQAEFTGTHLRLLTAEAQAPEESDWITGIRDLGMPVTTYSAQTLFTEKQIQTLGSSYPSPFTRFRNIVEGDPGLWQVKTPVDTPPLGVHEQPLRLQSPVSWPQSAYQVKLPVSGGERGAQLWWSDYLKSDAINHYKTTRNQLMGKYSSSHLSAALAWGCLSVRQIWHDILQYEAAKGASEHTYWLRFELLWREYFHWSLRHHGKQLFQPNGLASRTPESRPDPARWQAWCNATTGVPMVDAGLRELRHTGHISNRLRQNMASYFIHQLKLDWRLGARWFEMYLADADVASNYGNWAYIAGCGHDPRPQRQFNLNRQLRQYDPHAEHIHYWCPELSGENATNIICHQTGEQILPLYPAPVVPAPDGD